MYANEQNEKMNETNTNKQNTL